MNILRQSILVVLTGAAIALAPGTASAEITFNTTVNDYISPFSWNGLNNGYLGWGHTSSWYNFQAPAGTVEILVTGGSAGVRPAFTVWSAGNYGSSAVGDWGSTYSQTTNSAYGTSFIGFADNSNDPYTNSHFGTGPSAVVGGAPALAGTLSIVGTNSAGDQYAELIFQNAVAGSWYFFALGGSGATSSNGGNVTVFVGPGSSPVPLPPAVWLFSSALAGLGFTSIRKKNHSLSPTMNFNTL